MATTKPKDAAALAALITAHRPPSAPFEAIYKDLHQHPELSNQESRTSAIAAAHLTSLGAFDPIRTSIGGHGVAGVFRNGPGPTVLLRADMDGLPVLEATGLPYASTARATDSSGRDVPVMAACGHDMHTTVLMATASTLVALRAHWSGTLVCVFQPAEEYVSGAAAMVADGLYATVPTPDIVLGQHVMNHRAGNVALSAGPVFSANDSLAVRVFGRGSHGTRPDLAVDPILTAAHIVVRLQSIVTREVRPGDLAVLTVGSVHAGDAANIIPDYADIQLTMRTYDAAVHKRVLAAIYRVVRAECVAAGCEREPEIRTIMQCPAVVNDGGMTAVLGDAFRAVWGDGVKVQERNPGSEDVGVLADAVGKPCVYWLWGGIDQEVWDKAEKEGTLADVPYNHSPLYAPVLQPTLDTGVQALALSALVFLDQKQAA